MLYEYPWSLKNEENVDSGKLLLIVELMFLFSEFILLKFIFIYPFALIKSGRGLSPFVLMLVPTFVFPIFIK